MGYLTAFLNSKLFKFTFKEYFPELLGDTREIRKVFFETVTVKPIDDEDWYMKKIVEIQTAKEKGVPTQAIEDEIDERFFGLYDLTEEERLLVRNTAVA